MKIKKILLLSFLFENKIAFSSDDSFSDAHFKMPPLIITQELNKNIIVLPLNTNNKEKIKKIQLKKIEEKPQEENQISYTESVYESDTNRDIISNNLENGEEIRKFIEEKIESSTKTAGYSPNSNEIEEDILSPIYYITPKKEKEREEYSLSSSMEYIDNRIDTNTSDYFEYKNYLFPLKRDKLKYKKKISSETIVTSSELHHHPTPREYSLLKLPFFHTPPKSVSPHLINLQSNPFSYSRKPMTNGKKKFMTILENKKKDDHKSSLLIKPKSAICICYDLEEKERETESILTRWEYFYESPEKKEREIIQIGKNKEKNSKQINTNPYLKKTKNTALKNYFLPQKLKKEE